MSEEELGRMSYDEIHEATRNAKGDELHRLNTECIERLLRMHSGKPGVSPLLSRRVVRAVLGPLLRDALAEMTMRKSSTAKIDAYASAVEACCRALLALRPDEPSPLEDE